MLQGNLRMTDAAMELVAQMSQLCRLEMQFFWQLTDDGAATPVQPSFMCLACRWVQPCSIQAASVCSPVCSCAAASRCSWDADTLQSLHLSADAKHTEELYYLAL